MLYPSRAISARYLSWINNHGETLKSPSPLSTFGDTALSGELALIQAGGLSQLPQRIAPRAEAWIETPWSTSIVPAGRDAEIVGSRAINQAARRAPAPRT